MTRADWITWAVAIAVAVAAGFGLGAWIDRRRRATVAEVKASDIHNLDEPAPPEEP